MRSDVLLCVNVDHVATVRQARRAKHPDPVAAARLCELAGCAGITAHLREDRRHIQDDDVWNLRREVQGKFNLELSVAPEVVDLAYELKPDQITLVPERRQEVTTEGGLDVRSVHTLSGVIERFSRINIDVSLFVNPEEEQVRAAYEVGADAVELNTGAYAEAGGAAEQEHERQRLLHAAACAHGLGLKVNAGHGLNYANVGGVVRIPHILELNIGHAIVARAVMVGMAQATREMLSAMAMDA